MLSTRVKQSVVLAGLMFGATQSAGAQTCIGFGNLGETSRSLSTYAGGVGSERLAVGRFGISGERAFGGLQAGYGGNRGLNNPETIVLGLDAGLRFNVPSTGIEICPVVQSLYERGKGYDGFRNHNLYSSGGLGVGRAFNITRSFAIVPFVDARFLVLTRTNTGRSLSLYSSAEPGSYSRNGSQLNAGIGFRFGKALTIRPAVGTRQGFANFENQGAMSISASYNFRR